MGFFAPEVNFVFEPLDEQILPVLYVVVAMPYAWQIISIQTYILFLCLYPALLFPYLEHANFATDERCDGIVLNDERFSNKLSNSLLAFQIHKFVVVDD